MHKHSSVVTDEVVKCFASLEDSGFVLRVVVGTLEVLHMLDAVRLVDSQLVWPVDLHQAHLVVCLEVEHCVDA